MMGVVEVVHPIEIGETGFEPASIEILAGTSIRWTNRDTRPHTVTAADGSFDSAEIEPNATYMRTFPEPGNVSYHCEIHPDFTATVLVT